MTIRRAVAGAVLCLTASLPAFAQQGNPPPQYGPAPTRFVPMAPRYGAAGCGLGSLIFGGQPGPVQILAATTNGTFGSQTFGITSGTSNCDTTYVGVASTRKFIETNRQSVAKDISRGSGETLQSISQLAGCRDSKSVGSVLQRDFKSIFPSATVNDASVSESVVNTLKKHQELGCQQLG